MVVPLAGQLLVLDLVLLLPVFDASASSVGPSVGDNVSDNGDNVGDNIGDNVSDDGD